jgi:hypothetical protein
MRYVSFVLLLLAVCLLGVSTFRPADAGVTAAWPAADPQLRDSGVTVAIDISTATTTALVAATSGKQILITGLFIQSEGTQDVTIYSGSTAKTGAIEFADGDTLFLDLQSAPIMLSSGEALNLVTTGAVQINGWATYVLR